MKLKMSTQSNYELNIEYNPGGQQQPVACVDVYINDVLYHVPCEDYDQAIQEGRTKFVTHNDHVKMITPEQYELLEEAMKMIRKSGNKKIRKK